MAIRFQCSFCSQPIEVDDEWASKTVACPYCRKTITAPMESTLTQLSQIPTATPWTGALESSPDPRVPPYQTLEPSASSPNGVALVAFVLACAMLVVAACLVGLIAAYGEEMAELAKPGASFAQNIQEMTEYMESHGGTLPGWLVATTLLEVGVGMLWIATLVCGVVGVRHPRRRRLAVASLVIAAVTPIVLCCGSGVIVTPYA